MHICVVLGEAINILAEVSDSQSATVMKTRTPVTSFFFGILPSFIVR
jgi:hypothetical protein